MKALEILHFQYLELQREKNKHWDKKKKKRKYNELERSLLEAQRSLGALVRAVREAVESRDDSYYTQQNIFKLSLILLTIIGVGGLLAHLETACPNLIHSFLNICHLAAVPTKISSSV